MENFAVGLGPGHSNTRLSTDTGTKAKTSLPPKFYRNNMSFVIEIGLKIVSSTYGAGYNEFLKILMMEST